MPPTWCIAGPWQELGLSKGYSCTETRTSRSLAQYLAVAKYETGSVKIRNARTHRVFRNALLHITLHGKDELQYEVKEEQDEGEIKKELQIARKEHVSKRLAKNREDITDPKRTYGKSECGAGGEGRLRV